MVDEEYDNTYVRSGEFDRDFIKATKLRSVSTLDNRSTASITICRLCDMDENCKLYYDFITWKCCPTPPRKENGKLINRIYKPIDTPEEELIATMVEALEWQQNHPEPEPRKRKRKVKSDTGGSKTTPSQNPAKEGAKSNLIRLTKAISRGYRALVSLKKS